MNNNAELVKEILKAKKLKNFESTRELEEERKKLRLFDAIDNLKSTHRDDFISLIEEFSRLNGQIEYLQDELKEVKSELYKDEELQSLKKERDKAREELRRGFGISTKENEKLNNWMENHEKVCKHQNVGCGGGKYKYIFFPTGIGTFGTVKCSCGAEFDFQEAY